MPNDYLPTRDTELSLWLGNFVTVAQTNITLLAFLPADLMSMNTDTAAFTGGVAQLNAAKVTMKSATQNKNTARKKEEARSQKSEGAVRVCKIRASSARFAGRAFSSPF